MPTCAPLFRPLLEYAMQASPPRVDADAYFLDQIQRLVGEERLRRLGLHPLNKRRRCGKLIAAYKVLSGGLGVDPSLFDIRQCGQA